MEREEFYKLHEEAVAKSGTIALQGVSAMNLPKKVDLPVTVIGLGKKATSLAAWIRKELDAEHGSDLPIVVATALHEYWFACCDGAAYIALSVENGGIEDNDTMRRLATPDGYGEMEGRAATLSNGMAALNPKNERIECIKILMSRPILEVKMALKCMSLYWFCEAGEYYLAGRLDSAHDALHEAYKALESMHIYRVWDDAWGEAVKDTKESLTAAIEANAATRARSENASRAALIKYKTNPELIAKKAAKDLAKECWDLWQKKPSSYKGQSAFANDVLTKVPVDDKNEPVITYSTIINKWIPEWNRLDK
jgi:hypothetical protein